MTNYLLQSVAMLPSLNSWWAHNIMLLLGYYGLFSQ